MLPSGGVNNQQQFKGLPVPQVKVWTPNNGFCFVTFSEHTAPVTGLAFLPNSAAVVSASLDGTVRAYDLIRYRNFRTMTSPTPQQFDSLAVDPSGEVWIPLQNQLTHHPSSCLTFISILCHCGA